jgi:NAD(P)-dependent dehydrogenase (short-subunit alcohol dehydrogenase family)
VTDGTTRVGQAVVRAVIGAGAQSVWVGYADAWTKAPEAADLAALPQVTLLPLNLTDSQSVKRAAADIGAKIDILINTGEVHPALREASRDGVEGARAEMDVNYFGLLRLAQEFGPAMRARGAQEQSSAAAWVNLLSVYALSNYPPRATYSASEAAALSLAQCLRAEMRSAGVRVINVFPGPIDDEWNRMLPPPKLTAGALAKAVVGALQDGIEDVYPGDLAQEWLARWEEDPKLLERDLSA